MATPVAVDDLTYTVTEDSILKVLFPNRVLANDTDGDGDQLAAHVVTNPRNPLFDFKTNGTFTYDARYHGQLWLDTDPADPILSLAADGDVNLVNGFDSLGVGAVIYDEYTYVANDGQDDSNTATVRIQITGVNDDPVAVGDSLELNTGATDSVDVLANDTDVDIWPTRDDENFVIVALADIADDGGPAGGSDSDPGDVNGLTIETDAGGTVTLVAGELQYEAASDFFGIDTFQYTMEDPWGGSSTATVRVTVLPTNVAPDAMDDTRSVNEDDGEQALASVLGNDTDADDAPLIAADLIGTTGSGGTSLRRVDALGNTIAGDTGILVDFNSDGTFSYNPNGEFESLATGETAYVAFDYTAYDGHGASDTATVTIEIHGENDTPGGFGPGEAPKVYEAGLSTGSQDDPTNTGIPIVQNIDFTLNDVDSSDTPFLAGTTGGATTQLTGTYGYLDFIDEDTVRYTLTSNADHAALQGHNDNIFDEFTVYVVDGNGGVSDPLTVSVEIVDDINFLASLPVDGNGAPIGTLDTLDDKTVSFAANATTSDTFTLVPGADGQTLNLVGKPGNFTLGDGRVITSSYDTIGGEEGVRGTWTDSNGTHTFYELSLDPDPDNDATTLLGQYSLKIFENPPSVINDLDFSALKAGGPVEHPIVENIGFDGGFFTNSYDLKGTFNDDGDPNKSDDFINPNNSGGIGIGNGNIDQFEVLQVDVTGSSGTVTGLELDVKGAGGGVGLETVLWEAYLANGTKVDSGAITRDFSGQSALTLSIDPSAAFDFLYIGMDASTTDGNNTYFDGNDTVRINRIATKESVAADDYLLRFALASGDGDSDEAPYDGATANHDAFEFVVTLDGAGTNVIDPGLTVDTGWDAA